MIKRRLHQRKSFWLGLCLLLFLGWAWFSSEHRATKLRIGSVRAHESIEIGQSSGAVFTVIYFVPYMDPCDVPIVGTATGSFNVFTNSHGNPHFSIPPPMVVQIESAGWFASIAHWFLIVLYLVLWVLWMRWRSRLERRFVDSTKTQSL
jgi:hypothetical protein